MFVFIYIFLIIISLLFILLTLQEIVRYLDSQTDSVNTSSNLTLRRSAFPSHLFNLIFPLVLILLVSEQFLRNHKVITDYKVKISNEIIEKLTILKQKPSVVNLHPLY